MDLAALRLFLAVVEEGSVTRAAERLHTVQSNVTTRLRQLESSLGTPLFDRINRRLVITPAGRLLADYAERLLALAEEAREAVTASDAASGPLRLGSMETTAAARLPAVLAAFRAKHPAVTLRLRTGHSSQLVEEVLNHELDAALVAAPVRHPLLETLPVVEEELALVSAPDWPTITDVSLLAERAPVAIFTFREGCAYRQRLIDWLRREGIPIAETNDFGTFEAILGCVAAGMGITLMPRAVLDGHLRGRTIRAHPAPPDVARATTLMVWHRERSRHPARDAFAALLRERLNAGDEAEKEENPAARELPSYN